MRAGLLESCSDEEPKEDPVAAGAPYLNAGAVRVVSVSFGSDSFQMHTNPIPFYEWLYTIDLDYVNVFDPNVEYPQGLPE